MSATSTFTRSSIGGMSTLTGTSTGITRPEKALGGGTGSGRDDPNQKPTASEVFEELFGLYEDSGTVAGLMRLFTRMSEDLDRVRNGDRETIRDMREEREAREIEDYGYLVIVGIPNNKVHDLLEHVMRDLATATPGSTHEMVNRHFLPPGYVFMHDNAKGCVLAII